MNYFALYARIRRKATCSARNRICEMYSHADFLSYAGWDFGHADFADDADFWPYGHGLTPLKQSKRKNKIPYTGLSAQDRTGRKNLRHLRNLRDLNKMWFQPCTSLKKVVT